MEPYTSESNIHHGSCDKHYQITGKPGEVMKKRVVYINPEKEFISLNVISSMPNVLKVKTPSLLLNREGM